MNALGGRSKGAGRGWRAAERERCVWVDRRATLRVLALGRSARRRRRWKMTALVVRSGIALRRSFDPCWSRAPRGVTVPPSARFQERCASAGRAIKASDTAKRRRARSAACRPRTAALLKSIERPSPPGRARHLRAATEQTATQLHGQAVCCHTFQRLRRRQRCQSRRSQARDSRARSSAQHPLLRG